MQQTTAKVIDLQEYKETKEKEIQDIAQNILASLNSSEDIVEHKYRPYYSIMLPQQFADTYVIPDCYKRLWNRIWAVGFTLFVIMGLSL